MAVAEAQPFNPELQEVRAAAVQDRLQQLLEGPELLGKEILAVQEINMVPAGELLAVVVAEQGLLVEMLFIPPAFHLLLVQEEMDLLLQFQGRL